MFTYCLISFALGFYFEYLFQKIRSTKKTKNEQNTQSENKKVECDKK